MYKRQVTQLAVIVIPPDVPSTEQIPIYCRKCDFYNMQKNTQQQFTNKFAICNWKNIKLAVYYKVKYSGKYLTQNDEDQLFLHVNLFCVMLNGQKSETNEINEQILYRLLTALCSNCLLYTSRCV